MKVTQTQAKARDMFVYCLYTQTAGQCYMVRLGRSCRNFIGNSANHTSELEFHEELGMLLVRKSGEPVKVGTWRIIPGLESG